MSVLHAVRSVWSPGDQVVDCSSGEGRPPTTGSFTMPSPGVTRHRILLATLILAAIGVGWLAGKAGIAWGPPILLAPIILLGGLLLRLPAVLVVLMASLISVFVTLTVSPEPVQLLALALVTVLALRLAYVRGGIGIHGMRGDRALVELKGRLKTTHYIPPLPRGWGRKVAIRAAPKALFSGDFIVSYRDGANLQVALVDVSGKGDAAASRAMMLSGSFGGLLGAVPATDFLPACNAYLLRSGDEGLVTAVQLDLDLDSGDYTITCAGHPPAAKYASGSGSWALSEARGLALGVKADVRWAGASGNLGKGDALMLFTDGMWGPRVDPDAGIDRLLGEAAILVQGGFTEAAAVIEQVSHRDDDCAIVIIGRT